MKHDFLASIEAPFRALAHWRARKRHAALAPAAERFAPVTRHHPAPFTCGEARYLNELEDWLAGHKYEDIARANGTTVADFLRACLPTASDADLARVILAAVKASAAWVGTDNAFVVYTDALACAALELAELERSLA